MESEKSKVADFIEYIENKKGTKAKTRLYFILRKNFSTYRDNEYEDVFIEDITDTYLRGLSGVGVRVLEEFKELRTAYIKYINLKKAGIESEIEERENYERSKKKQFSCKIRSDILKTLQTIQGKASYIERALLEKFERDGIILEK